VIVLKVYIRATFAILASFVLMSSHVYGLSAANKKGIDIGARYANADGACAPASATDSTPTAATPSSQNLDLNKIADKYKLQSAIVKQIKGSVVGDYKSTEPPDATASVLKLLIADVLLHKNPDLNSVVKVKSSQIYQTGDATAGDSMKLSEVIHETLSERSWDTGANMLIDAAGGLSEITKSAHDLGYKDTNIETHYTAGTPSGKNTTTSSDLTKAMEDIFTNDGDNYTIVKNAMKGENHFNISPAPEASKWGGTSKVAGNSGVFVIDSKQYIITLYKNGDQNDTSDDIKNASEDILEALDNTAANNSKTPTSESSCCSQSSIPSASGAISPRVGNGLPDDTKSKMQQIFVAGGQKFRVDPNFIAAFYYAENTRTSDSTNNGDSASPPPVTGDGKWRDPPPPYGKGSSWPTNRYNTMGAFQFIPSTWSSYAVDGNGDGKKDAQDLTDEAFGAAKYLAAMGGKIGAREGKLRDAAYGYNHSNTYVDSVLNTFKYLSGGGQSQVSGSESASSSCSDSGGGAVTIDGYTWPVDIPKAEVDSGYPWPCPSNCHHDNTPAFDLSTKGAVRQNNDASAVGKSEFAISDGKITSLHIYNGIPGCYILQLQSSKDGYFYAYIHARKPAVNEGDTVKSADKIAELGERKCTGNGSYPHLHIDRGSPKGATAGYECCRDEGMVDLINKLYAAL
jgi:hypothetical protein